MKSDKLLNYSKYWLPVIIFCFFIFMLSEKGEQVYIPPLPFLDKILHVILYTILGILYTRAHNYQWGKSAVTWTVLFTIIYGVSDEFHQSFVPGRVSSLTDVIADGIGGIVGFYVYNFFTIELKQVNSGTGQNSNY